MKRIFKTWWVALLIVALAFPAGLAEEGGDAIQIAAPDAPEIEVDGIIEDFEPAPEEIGAGSLMAPEAPGDAEPEAPDGDCALEAAPAPMDAEPEETGDIMKSISGDNAGLPTDMKLGLGESIGLDVSVNGLPVIYTISNRRVLKFKNSKLTGKKKGQATLNVYGTDGNLVATSNVKVLDAPWSVSLSKKSFKMKKGLKHTLKAKLPKDTASFITWKSSKKSVATVDENGVVTGVGVGKAKITAETFNGKKASCEVEVQSDKLPEKVSFEEKSIAIGEKETVTLRPVVNEGAEAVYTWSSKDSRIVSVDKKGKITGKEIGSTQIIVKTQNGKKAKLKVSVAKPPKKVNVDASVFLWSGSRTRLKVKLPSKTASYKQTWKSDDNRVATVDGKGVVTGVGAGTANVTVTTFNGKKASCKVTVQDSGSGPEPTKDPNEVGKIESITVRFGDTEVQDTAVIDGKGKLNISWNVAGQMDSATIEIEDPAKRASTYRDAGPTDIEQLDEYLLQEDVVYTMRLEVIPRNGKAKDAVCREVKFSYSAPLEKKFRDFISDARWRKGSSWSDWQAPKLARSRNLYYGCAALCADFSKFCFGMDDPVDGAPFTDLRQARPGDVITMGNQSDGTGHWYCVLDRRNDRLYVAEGNVDGLVYVGWRYGIDASGQNPAILGYHLDGLA